MRYCERENGAKDMILTTHNWQKWKRVFLTCPCHEIYRDEVVGLKQIYFKNYDFFENVKFGAISWKFDIFDNCLIKVQI